jgi:hypothetical protein
MTKAVRPALAVAGLTLVLATGAAAQIHAYPAGGQSPQQQSQDTAACADWAKSQTGYDPANPPMASQASAAPVTGSGARVRGAAVGAAVGAIGGNAGAGALGGAAAGGIHRRIRNQRTADAQNQANAQYLASQRDSFYRAQASCLKGRGYSVE